MKLVQPPLWLRWLYPSFTWRISNASRDVYLTFDDGPTPEVTEWVLEQLYQYKAQATFFLIGKNISRHDRIFQKLKESNHALGNHTYNHLKGWKTENSVYHDNFVKCGEVLDTQLFRPPYGKIKRSQANRILKTHKVIMWDVLTYDYDNRVSAQQCLNYLKQNVRPGSIIVFHDSVKAWPRLQEVLPQALEFLEEQGYEMKALS